MAKYDQLSNLLTTRILNGDYTIKEFPSERQLAMELGVAHMTARRALKQLIDGGLLTRAANGRLEVNRDRSAGRLSLQVAVMTPSFNSPSMNRWRDLIVRTVEQQGGTARQILYTHWDDPFILDSLNKFDGVFFIPNAERMPQELKERLAQTDSRLVVLDDDLSSFGIPSIRRFPPVFVQRLLDHLEEQGFRNIDCFNVQPNHEVIEQRISQWKLWMNAHRLEGRLISDETQSYTAPQPHAHKVIERLLNVGELHSEVLFCVTIPAAIGAARAIYEAGLKPGVDIAICAIDGESMAEFQIPSITALEPPDEESQLRPCIISCLQWMAGEQGWTGSLLMDPNQPNLVIRESTMHGPRTQNTTQLQPRMGHLIR